MSTTSFDHLAPERSEQFLSMGFVCQHLQILPGQLRVLMEDTGVKFSQVVDGIGYLSIADAEAVAAKCVEVRKEIHDVVTSHERN
jgi:hypothetical protein